MFVRKNTVQLSDNFISAGEESSEPVIFYDISSVAESKIANSDQNLLF